MTHSPLSAFHAANAVTYLSLLSAIGAVAAALHHDRAMAGALIAASVIADTFDGRFAGLFRRTADQRALGVQLDSLSDAIAFGVAPCICATLLMPPQDGWLAAAWWAGCFVFGSSALTRLAFYNVTHDHVAGFVGLPAPVAALLWSTLMLADPTPATSLVLLLAAGAAMVSPLRVPRPSGGGLALFAAWPLIVIAAHLRPW